MEDSEILSVGSNAAAGVINGQPRPPACQSKLLSEHQVAGVSARAGTGPDSP